MNTPEFIKAVGQLQDKAQAEITASLKKPIDLDTMYKSMQALGQAQAYLEVLKLINKLGDNHG